MVGWLVFCQYSGPLGPYPRQKAVIQAVALKNWKIKLHLPDSFDWEKHFFKTHATLKTPKQRLETTFNLCYQRFAVGTHTHKPHLKNCCRCNSAFMGDNIKHAFADCPKLAPFWKEVQHICSSHSFLQQAPIAYPNSPLTLDMMRDIVANRLFGINRSTGRLGNPTWIVIHTEAIRVLYEQFWEDMHPRHRANPNWEYRPECAMRRLKRAIQNRCLVDHRHLKEAVATLEVTKFKMKDVPTPEGMDEHPIVMQKQAEVEHLAETFCSTWVTTAFVTRATTDHILGVPMHLEV